MAWKQRLFNIIILRNIFADFGGRSAYSTDKKDFIPYFEFKTGAYQDDFYLYFLNKPYTLRYTNEIFNKLVTYKGYDIIRYIEFHFNNYPHKLDFLRFLHYEISERLKRKPSNDRKIKYQSAFDWVGEKLLEFQAQEKQLLRDEIGKGVQKIVEDQQAGDNLIPPDLVQRIAEMVIRRFEDWAGPTEEKFKLLLGSLPAADIELNNQSHYEKLVQLLYLIQTIHVSKGEPLFKKFTNHDLASLLHLHFADFKDKKLNTVEKNIKDARDKLKGTNPKGVALSEALQNFFT